MVIDSFYLLFPLYDFYCLQAQLRLPTDLPQVSYTLRRDLKQFVILADSFLLFFFTFLVEAQGDWMVNTVVWMEKNKKKAFYPTWKAAEEWTAVVS